MQRRLLQLLQKLRPSLSRRGCLQPDAEGGLRAFWSVEAVQPADERPNSRRTNRRRFASVFAFLLWALSLSPVASAESIADAGELTDLIVNIARYTSWPAELTNKGVTVCFAHGGALATPSAAVTAASAGDPSREVRRRPVLWRLISTPAQVPGCNIVWLHADVRPAPREWLSNLHDRPTLTLSNYADFTADGGIVGAYRLAGEWRFEVNLEALQRSGLNISAVALRLSQRPRPAALLGTPR